MVLIFFFSQNRNMYKDVTIHCKAGSIDTNRLLLASMSPYLESILSDVPVLDPMITILMKDIRVQDMEIFNLFLFNDLFVAHANKKDLRIVRKIAKLFKIDPLRLPTLKETEENVTKGSKDGSRKSVRSSSKNSGGKINERTARNFSKTNVRTPKENNTKKVMPESPLTRKRGRKAYEALPPPKRGRVASSKTSRSGVKLDQDESKISPSRMPLLSKVKGVVFISFFCNVVHIHDYSRFFFIYRAPEPAAESGFRKKTCRPSRILMFLFNPLLLLLDSKAGGKNQVSSKLGMLMSHCRARQERQLRRKKTKRKRNQKLMLT